MKDGAGYSRQLVGAVGAMLIAWTTGCMQSVPEVRGVDEAVTATVLVTAEGRRFTEVTLRGTIDDTNAMVAPAGREFLVVLTNEDDGLRHSINVYRKQDEPPLFEGEPVEGPGMVTYQIGPLDEGRYTFRCAVHPAAMRGALIAR